ncbi:hypothetical protein ACS0TY_024529 [Phlomoides rotata]
MEVKANQHEDQKPVSVLDQGDEFCRNRILAREPSAGQSSRIFYRAAEGVPFKWEMQPGTPKNPQEEEAILPLCPSPLMQSLGLPLPNIDHDDETTKKSRIWRLKKMAMKRINSDIVKKVEIVLGRRSKLQESSRFGDCNEEFMVKDSSFSTYSSSSSSNVVDNDGPFCCSPWNVPAILEEGNTRIYYCSKHKTAFAVEEDGSFLSRILTRVSTGDQFSGPLNSEVLPTGVPFRWETQPGMPTHPPENDLMIPPPSPPPVVLSLSLPPYPTGEREKKSSWKRAWIWFRHRDDKKKEIGKMQHEISFRCNQKMASDWEFDASFRESGSVSSIAPLSRNGSKIRRNFRGRYLSCGPWRKEDILVFARRKLKPCI